MHKIMGNFRDTKKSRGNLSTILGIKKGKKRVIHEVIHIIHKKVENFMGLHSWKKERAFCEEIIKLPTFKNKPEILLTFQK